MRPKAIFLIRIPKKESSEFCVCSIHQSEGGKEEELLLCQAERRKKEGK